MGAVSWVINSIIKAMLRVSSYTFGCKLNQSETDAALNLLVDSGYELVSWDSGADLYLINTCTVTTKGEQKSPAFNSSGTKTLARSRHIGGWLLCGIGT